MKVLMIIYILGHFNAAGHAIDTIIVPRHTCQEAQRKMPNHTHGYGLRIQCINIEKDKGKQHDR